MIDEFIKSAGGKLGERWITEIFAPAGLFWLAIAISYLLINGTTGVEKLPSFLERWELFVLVFGVVLLVATAAIMHVLLEPTLRLLEGYWKPLWLRAPGIALQQWKAGRLQTQFESLQERQVGSKLSAVEYSRLSGVEMQLRSFPADVRDFMPTALGNVLRASERRPAYRYGLDAIVCWPQMWLLLPDDARNMVASARSSLDASVLLLLYAAVYGAAVVVYGLLAHRWSVALIIAAIIVVYFAYLSAIRNARPYGALIESVYDVYRFKLYEAFRFVPPRPELERSAGEQVTRYVFRGTLPTFSDSK